MEKIEDGNQFLEAKYRITAWFYDVLDWPWERQYRHWRPKLVGDLRGAILELGVGTGRNLAHYGPGAHVSGVDLSAAMLKRAAKRARGIEAQVSLHQGDASNLAGFENERFDWVVATFLCCVMPENLQSQALAAMARVLKPGGGFRLLEMVYSKDEGLRRRQERFAPFVQKVYGAGFDRNTLAHVKANPSLRVTKTSFLKADTYLLIEGEKQS